MESIAWIIRIVILGAIGIWVILQLKGKTANGSAKYERIIRQKSPKLKKLKKYNSDFNTKYEFAEVPKNTYYSKTIDVEEFDVDEVVKEMVVEHQDEIDEIAQHIHVNKALWNKYVMGYNDINAEETGPIEGENISDMSMYTALELRIIAANRMPQPQTKTKFTFTILHPKGKSQETEVVQCTMKELKEKYYVE